MDERYMGTIVPVGFNFVARNFASCSGAIMAISQFNALYALLSTAFGGDGRSSFGLPDLQGRTAIGMGQGPGLTDRVIGQKTGKEYTQLGVEELPTHTHTHTYAHMNKIYTNNTGTTLEATTQEGTITVPENGAFLSATKEIGSGGADNMYVRANEVQVADLVTLGGVTDGPGAGFDNDAFIIDNAGLGREFLNMQPSLVINYQICTVGLFPSRA